MNKSRLLFRVGVEGVGWIPSALIIQLSQPSLAWDGAWAELGKNYLPTTKRILYDISPLTILCSFIFKLKIISKSYTTAVGLHPSLIIHHQQLAHQDHQVPSLANQPVHQVAKQDAGYRPLQQSSQ